MKCSMKNIYLCLCSAGRDSISSPHLYNRIVPHRVVWRWHHVPWAAWVLSQQNSVSHALQESLLAAQWQESDCLVLSGCCNTVTPTGGLVNNRNLLLTALEAGSPRSGCQHVRVRALFLVHSCAFSLCSPSHGGRGKGTVGSLLLGP